VVSPTGPVPIPPTVETHQREYDDMASVLGLDPGTTDPNKEYRWVNRSAVKVARAKIKGYSMVRRGDVTPLVDVDIGPDNSLLAGDLVLMSTDKAVYKRRKQKEQDLTLSRTQRAGEESLEKGKRLGIKTFRDDSDTD